MAAQQAVGRLYENLLLLENGMVLSISLILLSMLRLNWLGRSIDFCCFSSYTEISKSEVWPNVLTYTLPAKDVYS